MVLCKRRAVSANCGRKSGAETVAAAALHRSAVLGEEVPVARVVDLESVIEVLRGKIEFESGEEGRELEILAHLLRKAVADTVREHLGGIDLGPFVATLEDGHPVVTGDRVSAADLLGSLPADEPVGMTVDAIAARLDADTDGERAAAVELALDRGRPLLGVDRVARKDRTGRMNRRRDVPDLALVVGHGGVLARSIQAAGGAIIAYATISIFMPGTTRPATAALERLGHGGSKNSR